MYAAIGNLAVICLLVVCISCAPPALNNTKELTIKDFKGPMTNDVIASLKEIEFLIITHCNLTDYPPKVFSKLPNLKRLSIDHTQFHIIDNDIYKDAHSLEEIEFHHNHVPELRLSLLRESFLKKVDINNQEEVKIISKDFANETKRLHEFKCNKCKIDIIEEGAFNNLDKLEILDLHNNIIKTLPSKIFDPLKSLKKLDLSTNLIEKFDADALSNLHNLESLNLSNNPLSELNFINIAQVTPKLKTVDVKNTKLSHTQIEELKKNTNINFLHDN